MIPDINPNLSSSSSSAMAAEYGTISSNLTSVFKFVFVFHVFNAKEYDITIDFEQKEDEVHRGER